MTNDGSIQRNPDEMEELWKRSHRVAAKREEEMAPEQRRIHEEILRKLSGLGFIIFDRTPVWNVVSRPDSVARIQLEVDGSVLDFCPISPEDDLFRFPHGGWGNSMVSLCEGNVDFSVKRIVALFEELSQQ